MSLRSPKSQTRSSQPIPASTLTAWHTFTPEEAIAQIQSDRTAGLSQQQATERFEKFGPNELEETAGRGTWEIVLDQFKNIMLIMLIVVAIVSAVLDILSRTFPKDAIAIFAIVVLNGVLGYLQESRAEKALAALKRMASPRIRTIRDGREQEVSAKDLVPGDLMLLEAGGQVAADGLLLDASNLQVRESALTGEAEAVNKRAGLVLPEDAALGDRLNRVFQGTEVIQGRATVLVTDTGMQTELGRIASLLQNVESEPTPLQQRMAQLGNVLVSGAMILVGLVVVGGLLRTGDLSLFDDLLEVSLSMAVAVVPEGLPAVITVTLALGTQRMVRRQALIRKLPAVETLGSVTTICSDKTGTLTQNKMVVQEVHTGEKSFQVTGDGYSPVGDFHLKDESTTAQTHPDLMNLLLACALCNDATLQHEGSLWTILGDPTEGALLTLAGKGGLDKATLTDAYPRVGEIPFSSERKRMSVLCTPHPTTQSPNHPTAPHLLLTKGSPELVLERCTHFQLDDACEPLTQEWRDRILQQNNQMAQRGLRVLGLAMRNLEQPPPEEQLEAAEQQLTWLGLVGMLDAPRPEVRAAVAECRQAGIRPVMITGDHPLTARAIAQDLGIASQEDDFLTGQELERLTPEALEEKVPHISVYARVAPEHKLRIVQALQHRGEFVAMTGDGVNDAPALKQADIGIAMGITGTDVSKEASDMVLLDDNFATIVAATEEGRVVYDNIRRFIKYILGSNIGEVLTIAAAPLIGLGGVPLSPLQILWMNLVTDGLPALALAMEPAEPDVMQRPPYNPRESIFARGMGSYMIRVGLVLAILTIALMVWAYNYTHAAGYPGSPDTWKTMVFTTLCLAQMGHAMAVRSDTQLTYQLNPFSNPYVLGSVVLTTVLQLLLIYVPVLRNFFGLHPLSLVELAICFGFSALMFIWIEAEKLFIRTVLHRRYK
ncbi:MAG: cation-translocating P-type ATPase [Synechococcales bacterium]|nr:cation-translocating P-type ATPase [Synechococcales bacterium]